MSTERGNGSRTRAQKHKNRHVFKNDLHDKTPMQIRLNSLHISEVCQHCKGVIEWKIKYKKYKPLSQAKTCTKCQQKKIKKAYHVLCRDCAREARVCAKCLKSSEEVEIEPPKPTPQEEQMLKSEMERLIKSFPERKRRAFLRYMDKGKKTEEEEEEAAAEGDGKEATTESENSGGGGAEDESEEKVKVKLRIPHTRDELLLKIEQLKLNHDANNDFNSDDDDDNDDDDDDDDDDDEDEEYDLSEAD